MALVERGGKVRTHVVADVTGATLKKAIRDVVDKSARIVPDEWAGYRGIGDEFDGGHETVRHRAKEYARGDVYTNTAESYFSLFKRGIQGAFHFVSKQHLGRYCDEFAFRWSRRHDTDGERAEAAIRGADGKRLVYRDSTSTGSRMLSPWPITA